MESLQLCAPTRGPIGGSNKVALLPPLTESRPSRKTVPSCELALVPLYTCLHCLASEGKCTCLPVLPDASPSVGHRHCYPVGPRAQNHRGAYC